MAHKSQHPDYKYQPRRKKTKRCSSDDGAGEGGKGGRHCCNEYEMEVEPPGPQQKKRQRPAVAAKEQQQQKQQLPYMMELEIHEMMIHSKGGRSRKISSRVSSDPAATNGGETVGGVIGTGDSNGRVNPGTEGSTIEATVDVASFHGMELQQDSIGVYGNGTAGGYAAPSHSVDPYGGGGTGSSTAGSSPQPDLTYQSQLCSFYPPVSNGGNGMGLLGNGTPTAVGVNGVNADAIGVGMEGRTCSSESPSGSPPTMGSPLSGAPGRPYRHSVASSPPNHSSSPHHGSYYHHHHAPVAGFQPPEYHCLSVMTPDEGMASGGGEAGSYNLLATAIPGTEQHHYHQQGPHVQPADQHHVSFEQYMGPAAHQQLLPAAAGTRRTTEETAKRQGDEEEKDTLPTAELPVNAPSGTLHHRGHRQQQNIAADLSTSSSGYQHRNGSESTVSNSLSSADKQRSNNDQQPTPPSATPPATATQTRGSHTFTTADRDSAYGFNSQARRERTDFIHVSKELAEDPYEEREAN
ncbi:hypothetical protein ZHAS_00009454 [Anopheles sinensis]|uniref:Uncharacterized protein n=1 Tax=Anopheles sinensis TaxID=74873 RepID=A0A084VVA1_ANOSI|nr:hypothetical protein ZHAS_00009454 [Anopheles sinensis]